MNTVMSKLEKYRRLKLLLYFVNCILFITISVINLIFRINEWIYYLVLFINCLLFIINIFLIEVQVGYRFKKIYVSDFLPTIIKSLEPKFEYKNAPIHFHYDFFDNHFYHYAASSKVDHTIKTIINDQVYELLDVKLYFNTHLHKILLFRGYILSFKNKDVIDNEILILYDQKPLFNDFKEKKRFSFPPYKVYSLNEKVDTRTFRIIQNLLTNKLHNGEKYNIFLGEEIIIFKRYLFSVFKRPHLFQPINKVFLERKKSKVKIIIEMMNDFINSLENQ